MATSASVNLFMNGTFFFVAVAMNKFAVCDDSL